MDETLKTNFRKAIVQGNLELVKEFVELHKLNVNDPIRLEKGVRYPPLFIAIRYDRREIIKYLFEQQNASPILPDTSFHPQCETCLHYICTKVSNAVSKFKHLMETYPEKLQPLIHSVDPAYYTPLDYAVAKGHFELVKYIADNFYSNDGKPLDPTTSSRKRYRYMFNSTILNTCIRSRNLEMLKYLVSKFNIKLNNYNTPKRRHIMCYAIWNNDIDMIRYLYSEIGMELPSFNLLCTQSEMYFVQPKTYISMIKEFGLSVLTRYEGKTLRDVIPQRFGRENVELIRLIQQVELLTLMLLTKKLPEDLIRSKLRKMLF